MPTLLRGVDMAFKTQTFFTLGAENGLRSLCQRATVCGAKGDTTHDLPRRKDPSQEKLDGPRCQLSFYVTIGLLPV